jgi:hypothetical protein
VAAGVGDGGAGHDAQPQARQLMLADAYPKFGATVFSLQLRTVVVEPDARRGTLRRVIGADASEAVETAPAETPQEQTVRAGDRSALAVGPDEIDPHHGPLGRAVFGCRLPLRE